MIATPAKRSIGQIGRSSRSSGATRCRCSPPRPRLVDCGGCSPRAARSRTHLRSPSAARRRQRRCGPRLLPARSVARPAPRPGLPAAESTARLRTALQHRTMRSRGSGPSSPPVRPAPALHRRSASGRRTDVPNHRRRRRARAPARQPAGGGGAVGAAEDQAARPARRGARRARRRYRCSECRRRGARSARDRRPPQGRLRPAPRVARRRGGSESACLWSRRAHRMKSSRCSARSSRRRSRPRWIRDFTVPRADWVMAATSL